MLYSMILGLQKYDEDILISYSDILFNSKIINKLINKKSREIKIPILKNWKKIWKNKKQRSINRW